IYREALASPHCTAIHLTLIDKDFDCDTTFPEFILPLFRLWSAGQPIQQEDGTR
ncbi:bifunctional dihydrofolate reductase-thymidylate synthase, partial [Haematococcus lacustris]